MNKTAIRAFRRLCLSTLIAVYFLIGVGGVVRTTGSGMGCPDWPKCFGSWVPPTSVSQLPSDYQQTYSALRDKKNQKFIKYLRAFGMKATADALEQDSSIREEQAFNATKTWIEYVNRLVGVIVGLLILVVFVRSWQLRKQLPGILSIAVITVIILLFQGWFGSIVVSTNLTTWTITVHMLLAIVIVFLLTYLFHRSEELSVATANQSRFRWLLIAGILLLLVQILLGTEVRSAIDRLAGQFPRTDWIGRLGIEFLIHRSFSWLVFLATALFYWGTRKTNGIKASSLAVFLLILLSLFSGATLGYLGVPAFIQPLHLVIAVVAIGLQVLILFRLSTTKDTNSLTQ